MQAIVKMLSGVVYAGTVIPSSLPGMLEVVQPDKTLQITESSAPDPETGAVQTRTVTYSYAACSVIVSATAVDTISPTDDAGVEAARAQYPADKQTVVYGEWA
jgi:hypothetical protein